MKKLDERKRGYEGKFARDQELEFKILARREINTWVYGPLKNLVFQDQLLKNTVKKS